MTLPSEKKMPACVPRVEVQVTGTQDEDTASATQRQPPALPALPSGSKHMRAAMFADLPSGESVAATIVGTKVRLMPGNSKRRALPRSNYMRGRTPSHV